MTTMVNIPSADQQQLLRYSTAFDELPAGSALSEVVEQGFYVLVCGIEGGLVWLRGIGIQRSAGGMIAI